MKIFFQLLVVSLVVSACSYQPTAEEILNNAIKAHGGNKTYNATVSFNFRDKHYVGVYKNGHYKLSRHFSDSLGNILVDKLTNSEFERSINDKVVALSDEWADKYSNSVNSVFYFFKLPFNLKDEAVILTYLGVASIENQNYYKLKVTFGEEGGGEDFDDVFVYWFNTETYTLDYLAYQYVTSGGGKRFRKAFNQRAVNGWIVSDFINYKPKDLNVDIADYDVYYAEDGFKKLSKIINKNVEISYN